MVQDALRRARKVPLPRGDTGSQNLIIVCTESEQNSSCHRRTIQIRKYFGFQNKEHSPDSAVEFIYNQRDISMLKITALTGALVIGLAGACYAQTTGPVAQDSTKMDKGMSNDGMGMHGMSKDGMSREGMSKEGMGMHGMAKDSTTGKSTSTGGSDGTSKSTPETTPGPAGSPSKDGTPAK